MEQELDIVNIISEKLNSYGLPSYESLKKGIKEYLLSIEKEIIEVSKERKCLIESYKKCKINISYIADKIGIARATIYNNKEVLETYIIKGQEEFEKSDLFKLLDDRIDKIKALNEIIIQLQNRDLDEQLYLDKIEFLEHENKNYIQQLKTLDELNSQYINRLKKLEQKIKKYDHDIIENDNILIYNDKTKET